MCGSRPRSLGEAQLPAQDRFAPVGRVFDQRPLGIPRQPVPESTSEPADVPDVPVPLQRSGGWIPPDASCAHRGDEDSQPPSPRRLICLSSFGTRVESWAFRSEPRVLARWRLPAFTREVAAERLVRTLVIEALPEALVPGRTTHAVAARRAPSSTTVRSETPSRSSTFALPCSFPSRASPRCKRCFRTSVNHVPGQDLLVYSRDMADKLSRYMVDTWVRGRASDSPRRSVRAGRCGSKQTRSPGRLVRARSLSEQAQSR